MTGINSTKAQSENLKIAKTIKLFIGGEFPRTESGRSFPVYVHKTKKIYANLCLASRKDLRNAVTAAQAAQPGWQAKSAYNRGQILYRMAEMLEAKRVETVETLVSTLGYTEKAANAAVDEAVDSFVYYAGFSDKYQQVLGAVNPVSGPHHNFTSTEPVGVVALVADEKFDLGKLADQIASIIVTGNSLVVLMAEQGSACIAPLSEALATSDLSKGVVNLLTGSLDELCAHLATHMEIQAVSFQSGDKKKLALVKTEGAMNMKRIASKTNSRNNLENLMNFVEFKTVWHPIGN